MQQRRGMPHKTSISTDDSTVSRLNVLAPIFHPCGRNIWEASDFVQTLHQLSRPGFSKGATAQVCTRLLAPGREIITCEQPRSVDLIEDHNAWERQIREMWNDLLSICQPSPFFLEEGVTAHIVIVQQPKPASVGALVTLFDLVRSSVPTRRAVVLNEAISQDEILNAVGLRSAQAYFSVWLGQMQLVPGLQTIGTNGISIFLQMHRHPSGNLAANLQSDLGVQDDIRNLLKLGQTLPQPSEKLHIDLHKHKAFELQEWLDTHFTLPCFDIEAQLEGAAQWMPGSLEWIRGHDWFACDQPVDKIRIYYDGSYVKTAQTIGYAAAAFVQIQGAWIFAGALSGKDAEADDSAS